MIKVFIEYDPKEAVAFHLQSQSVLSNTEELVEICAYKTKSPELLKGLKDWCLFLEKGFLVSKDISEAWKDVNRKVGILKTEGAFLINAKAFNKLKNKSIFESAFPEKKVASLPYIGLFSKDVRPWLIEEESDPTWDHYWSLIQDSRGSAKTIVLNNRAYDKAPPRFKAPGLKANYQQLLDPDTKIYYVLFPEKLEYKGGPFKFSTAQCAYLGNRLANYFGLQTQKSSLIQTNEGVQLLTEDIRSCPSVSSMECLANLDKEIKRQERALNEWNSSLKRISKNDLSPFIVKLALFDLLIKNTNRSAGNIVWLDFNQGLLSESIHATRPEAGHSLLIENLFGFSDFYEGKALRPHSPEEILSFIKETDQSKVAMDFFEAMSPANMKEIVMESKGVSPDLKDQAIRILDEQFSVLLWIEEEVEKLS